MIIVRILAVIRGDRIWLLDVVHAEDVSVVVARLLGLESSVGTSIKRMLESLFEG